MYNEKSFELMTEEQKLEHAEYIYDFQTHNGYTKSFVILMFKWLWENSILR